MPEVFGHKFSKGELAAAGIGGVIVVYYLLKARGSGSSPTSSSSSTDPVTGLPYSEDNQVDPATGMTYLAEAQQYGSVSAAEQALGGQGLGSSYTGYGYGAPYGSYGTAPAVPLVPANETQAATYASNSAWAQAAESGLTDIGYSSTDIAAALGRYLGNLPETSAQATIVQAAIAEYGPPPVGTYQVILQPATGSTGSGAGTGSGSGGTGSAGTGSGGTGSTGGGGGSPAPASPPSSAPGGISVTPWPGFADMSWSPVAGATGYEVLVVGAGGRGTGTSHVDQWYPGHYASHVDLAPGAYRAQVRAWNDAGSGPWSGTTTFTAKQ